MNQRRAALVVTLCFSILTLPVLAQLPKTLLWRISGKDGHFVSYLYGTMHLSDDRVFNLGDSLYAAIRRSDGFAMEIDPGQMSAFIVDEVEKELTDSKKISELLSEKDYKKYAPYLEKKLHRPAKDITTKDILRERNRYIQQSYQTGDMTTFLDVYLFDLARRQGKWTGGVEDMDDQRGLTDNMVDENDVREMALPEGKINAEIDSAMMKMLRAYMDQDLSAIENISADVKNKDLMLIRRNKKMALRMDSLSSVRSMVFAVGAAHLPGDTGLIQLLRRRGFRVDPVISSTTIKAADYPVKEVPLAWSEVRDEDSLYRVSMPGKPSDLDLYGIAKMKMYFDIFNSTGYFSAGIRAMFPSNKIDSAMDKVASRSFGTINPRNYDTIVLNGAKGRVYTVKDKDGYKKGYLLFKNGIFYMAYGMAVKATEANKQMIEKFLGTFQVMDVAAPRVDSMALVEFEDTLDGYRLTVPNPAKPFKTGKSREGWSSRQFFSQDPAEQCMYFFGVSSPIDGSYIDNDSSYFQDLRKRAIDLLKTVDYDSLWVSNGQIIIELRGPLKAQNVYMMTRYYGRGSRFYSMSCVSQSPILTEKEHLVVESFTMIPYREHGWRKIRSDDSLFTVWAPSKFLVKRYDSAKRGELEAWYFSNDSIRAQSCNIMSYRLSPYYWKLSDTAFWQDRVRAHVSARDTLLSSKAVVNGDAQGWEMIKQIRGAHNCVRLRMLLNGENVYQLVLSTPSNEIHSSDNDRFFDDFRFTSPVAPAGYRQSKAALLLKDMFSADSATSANALANLTIVPWQQSELPLLHKALYFRQPGDDSSNDEHYIFRQLVKELKLLHYEASFQYAWSLYPSLPDSVKYMRRYLLDLMADFKDSVHYAAFSERMVHNPPTDGIPYSLVNKFDDTLTLIKPFFPQWLPLLKDSSMQAAMLYLTADMVDSSLLDISALQPYLESIAKYTESRLGLLKESPSDGNVYDKSLVRLLGMLGGSRNIGLLNRFLHIGDKYLQLDAVKELARRNQPIASAVLQQLAADKTMRIALYDALEKNKKLALFPAAYHTQKAFAETEVYLEASNADDDDTEDSRVYTYVTSRVYPTDKGPKLFYFFKVQNGEMITLACAGAYDQNPAHLNVKHATGFVSEEEYKPELLHKQMNALVQNWRDYEEVLKDAD